MNIIERWTGRVRWAPGLAMRVVLGVTFVGAGWGKLHNLEQVTAFFASLGIPAAAVQAPAIAALELVGGALLLVGLGTRIAAALLAGVMAVAILTAVAPAADGLVALLGTVEVIYLAAFLHLAVHGAGAVSLDRIVTKFTKTQGVLA